MLSESFDVVVSKLDATETFVPRDLSQAANDYIYQYGLKKCINDAHASIKEADFVTVDLWHDAVREAAYKRIDQLRSGNVPGTRTPSDSKAAKIRKVAATCAEGGIDLDALVAVATANPEKLVAFLKRQADAGRAA